MYKFHITGYAGNGHTFWRDSPVDITVFANSQSEAISKAQAILGHHISFSGRKIFIEEMEGAE